MPPIVHLECSRCHAHLSAATPQTVCTQCTAQPAGSLFVRYDLTRLRGSNPHQVVDESTSGWQGMWRYRAVLPEIEPVTLGEGWTPMIRSRRYPRILPQRGRRQPDRHIQGARACDSPSPWRATTG